VIVKVLPPPSERYDLREDPVTKNWFMLHYVLKYTNPPPQAPLALNPAPNPHTGGRIRNVRAPRSGTGSASAAPSGPSGGGKPARSGGRVKRSLPAWINPFSW